MDEKLENRGRLGSHVVTNEASIFHIKFHYYSCLLSEYLRLCGL